MARATFDQLCQLVAETRERLKLPGVAVGLIADGEEHAAGFGVTNVDHPLEVDADTLFQVGSISKTFTGLAAMRLVEQGRIELDAPVRRYLPEWRVADARATETATIRHLLTHTAGWLGDYFGERDPGDDALAKYVARMVEECPQLTPPGELYSYCNAGFNLLGRVIEVITGRTFETAMKELVLEPLGLQRSFYVPEEVMVHRFAVGHRVHDGEATVLTPWALARSAMAPGGIVASAREQLKYARFWLGDGRGGDGGRVLTPASMRLMQTSQATAAGHPDARIGLAWHLRDHDGTPIISHGGGTNGQASLLAIAPSRSFALSVLTNAGNGGELITPVQRWALEQLLGLQDPPPEPVDTLRGRLAEYAGRYTGSLSDVELRPEGEELVMHLTLKGGFPTRDSPPLPSPPPTRVALYAQDRLTFLDGPFKEGRAEVIRDGQGRIAWLRIGGRIRKPG
ncbi:MAG TPA: serine hydrolase domain-containing protein [Chloroflexota bacterium]|jgi:CubicO group peptidase (beta-lactamase class C family)|nr:serine hydrolase domain-containing protein [Chloroflexota bacterium]